MTGGFWQPFRLAGIPVRLHWTMPIAAFAFGGFRFVPVFWAAFVALVLAHELGHATIAKRYGQDVTAIEVTGYGGVCRWSGTTTEYQRGAIAWGGVMAQAVLAAGAYLVVLAAPPQTALGIELEHAFITINIALLLLNLLPIPPLDGWEAWPWLGQRFAWRRAEKQARRLAADDDLEVPPIEPPRLVPPRSQPAKPSARKALAPASPSGERAPSRTNAPFETAPSSARPPAVVHSDEELAHLLKSIAEEAAEQHRRERNRK